MGNLHLSKSRFCSAIQCPKMLWLKQNKPEKFDDSVMNETVLKTGNEVGDFAMGLFGPFVEVPFGDLAEMVCKTKDLIKAGEHIIAEASFADGENFCGVIFMLGCKHDDIETGSLHSAVLNIDESSLQYGVRIFGNIALDICGK